MENMDKKDGEKEGKDECEGCYHCRHHGMGMGCGFYGGRHHLLRVILKIVIVILIFWAGYNLGEMTGFLKAQYGDVRFGGYGIMGGDNFGMMRGYYLNNGQGTSVNQAAPQTQTTAPVVTPAK